MPLTNILLNLPLLIQHQEVALDRKEMKKSYLDLLLVFVSHVIL